MKTRFLFILCTQCLLTLTQKAIAECADVSNKAIVNDYSSICSNVCSQLEVLLSEPPTNALVAINSAGLLRCRAASRLLIENLAYPALPYLDGYKFIDYKRPAPVIYGIGFTLRENMNPAFAALESIGCDFLDLTSVIPKYDQLLMRDGLFTALGIACSGHFFEKYAFDMEKSGRKFAKFDVMHRQKPLPSSVWQITKDVDSAISNRYIAMQTTLISHFVEGLASSSADIADTIRTMGFIRSLKAIPLLTENLTICPQVSTNAPGGYAFPAAEALIEIGPAIGYCFAQLEETKPLSVEESLWLRISHELYPEGLEYDLMRRAETNDTRAVRLLNALPWRRLDSNYDIIGNSGKREERNNGSE